MENPSLVEDEVIADSEDEMEQDLLPAEGGLRGTGKHSKAATGNASSQVSAFTLTNHPHGKVVSSISAFPTNPSTSKEQIHGTAKTSDYGYPDYSVHLDDFIGAASIADRAKTRQRNTRPSTSSEVIELTSEEDELGLRPTPSKPRPRPKLKVKAKDSEIGQDKGKSKATFDTSLDLNIPNTSNSVPSIATDSNPKPRPRPRPVPKRPKGAHNESSNVPAPLPAPLPATPPTPYHGPELPVATSPPHPPPLTSQLPPSDPPLPTMTTTYGDDDVPRIETLPNDMDFDGPSSSPLSSVDGDRGGGGARNKRKRKELDVDIDELASSNAALGPPRGGAVAAGSGARHGFEKAAHISPRKMPPPPTFFAGSSSSSMGGGGGRVPPLEPAPEPDVVDLTMLPSTVDPTCIVAKKAVKPPAKPRKKKGEDADAMVVVLDEDEGDDDFNPGGKEKGKAKARPKAKPRVKKVSDGGTAQGAQVEVVITSKPKPRARATAKTKGKDKDIAANKDASKSSEYVRDSDEEDGDPMLLHPSAGNANTIPANAKSAHIPTSDSISKATGGPASVSKAGVATPHSGAFSSEAILRSNALVSSDFVGPQAAASSSSSVRVNKKRKSIIESDLDSDFDSAREDTRVAETSSTKKKAKKTQDKQAAVGGEEGVEASIRVNPSSSKAKDAQKGKAKAKKAAKNVILSEDDEDHEAREGQRAESMAVVDDNDKDRGRGKGKGAGKDTAKSRKNGSKRVHGADDDEDVYMDAPQDAHQEAEEASKENMIPAARRTSTIAAPKPNYTPKPQNPNLFPSLHSRYEIAPRKSSLPMSELIRRASIPGSSATPQARRNNNPTHTPASSSHLKPLKLAVNGTPTGTPTAYSPYIKSSRTYLSRIAPLHPNRRTPPPPPPPPPPKKKTKKELEMEEKWEEELMDSVGGAAEWSSLGEEEKKELRRAKKAREVYGDWD